VTFQWPRGRRTLFLVVTLIRVARVLLLLAVAYVMVTLVIALTTPDTGVLEKAMLVMLVVGCVPLAALLTAWTRRVEKRLVAR
jgi:hypothetical protein